MLYLCNVAFAQQVPETGSSITFSSPSGWYPEEFNLGLSGVDSIYYTLNGTEPSTGSALYSDSISIERNWANGISLIPSTYLNHGPDWPNSEFGFREPETTTHKCNTLAVNSTEGLANEEPSHIGTYWIGSHPHSTPVISIVTDSLNLFDVDSGIYLPGSHFDASNPDWTGNYFQRGDAWEKPAHLSYFNENGQKVFDQKIGIRVSGNASRRMPQKSLKLYFRSEYGESTVKNIFFPDRPNPDYKRLVLRTPFTYWYWSGGRNTLFQDELIHRIAFDSHARLDVALSTPVSVYLNNEYWGILNLRETHDKFFLESVYGLERDKVSIVNGANLIAETGSAEPLEWLLNFALSNDLSIENNYRIVIDSIDIRNYIDYFIFETYFGNEDWPVNNILIWRPDTGNAKWRWFFYDLDGGLNNPGLDPFQFMDNENEMQPQLFNAFMENAAFKQQFFNRYQYFLERAFQPERIAEQLSGFITQYEKEVDLHVNRWGNPSSHETWYNSCLSLYRFSEERPCYLKALVQDRFGTDILDSFDCGYADDESDFRLFPNPTSESATLKFNRLSFLGGYITVFSITGQLKLTKQIKKLSQNLYLADLEPGVYLVVVNYQDDVLTQKLIVY